MTLVDLLMHVSLKFWDTLPCGEQILADFDDDKTWSSNMWIGGMKLDLKEDITVATCPTDSSSEQ
jgi:hypothetical protein